MPDKSALDLAMEDLALVAAYWFDAKVRLVLIDNVAEREWFLTRVKTCRMFCRSESGGSVVAKLIIELDADISSSLGVIHSVLIENGEAMLFFERNDPINVETMLFLERIHRPIKVLIERLS